MKYLRTLSTLFLSSLLLSVSVGCSGGSDDEPPDTSGTEDEQPAGEPGEPGDVATGLAAAYEDYFPIGAAIEPSHLQTVPTLLESEFNHLTAENAMKWGNVEPTEGTFNWTAADTLAEVARLNGWKMTGHTFVWYRATPDWVFEGDLESIKQRLRNHIDAMVERYGDVVDNWDVVNEAISDDGYVVRDDVRYSEDVLYWAFKYTEEALEAREPGSSEGMLYYNDYNVNLKVDSILELLGALRDRGAQIDGIGLQAHVRLDWPSISEMESTINKIVAAGYKVKISELDVTVYADYPPPDYTLDPAPEVEWTPELDAALATRYDELFSLFRAHRDDITSVTLWGVADDHTWLENEPVPGRRNYPLLFDDDHQPKQAYEAILNF